MMNKNPAPNEGIAPQAGEGANVATDELLHGAIEKMAALQARMDQAIAVGTAPADYEIATKISGAARSALEILHKYANNFPKV